MGINTLLRKTAKAAALPLGIPTRRRAGDVVILLYHRVGVGDEEIDVAVDVFDRHLTYLSQQENVLSLDEALANGSGGVVLTFDDGFLDFHEHVLPLLVRHRLPATLYLATGLVGEGQGPRPNALRWRHLQDAVATGLVAVGSHTHDHVDLSRAGEAVADTEMRRSKDLIEDRLGVACRHFAYPWAVGSAAAERVSRRLFDSAALRAWQTNRAGRIDPHRLGRIPILRSDGDLFFRAKVRGRLDAEGLVYRMLRRGPWRP